MKGYNKLMRKIIRQGFNDEIPEPYLMVFYHPVLAALQTGFKIKKYPNGIDGVCNEFDGHYIIAVCVADKPHRVIDSLAHELVHIWQDFNGLPMNHGKTFKKKLLKVLENLT